MDLLRRLAVKAGLFVLSLFAILVAEFLFFQIDLSCASNFGSLTYNQCWSSYYLPPLPPKNENVSIIIVQIGSRVRSAYGVGQPVWIRFIDYLRLMLTGNFGYNVSNVISGWVPATISQRLPFTALLSFSVAAVVVVLNLVLGLSAFAGRAKRLSPLPVVAFALAGVGLPVTFLWGLWSAIHPGGLTWFASLLPHLVPSGYVTVASSTYMSSGLAYYGAVLQSMLAPFLEAAAMVFLTILLVRFLLRGPASFMTTLTLVLVSSSLWTMLLEMVFDWPGLGEAMYLGWNPIDYPLEQALVFEVLVIMLVVVFAFWCAEDIVSALRTPSVTTTQDSGGTPAEQPSVSAPSMSEM